MQLPEVFLNSIKNVKGFDEAAFIKVHQSVEQITAVRLNASKKSAIELEHLQSPIPWSSQGYYLNQRPSFTIDPFFHSGAYYVQEASSMFLEQALIQTLELSKPIKILDLCAAPGGKSTLIQSLICKESLLVSNEVIKTRVTVLCENISKWGAANVIVTNNDAKDFARLPDYFDAIVVDAPCSGSGLFRKDAAAIDEWSFNNVQLCSQRQQRIVADVLPALKENGVLIYATCSYSAAEDEMICDWLVNDLKLETIALKIEENWNIVESKSDLHNAYGYRFFPDKVKGEGFFIAAFKKIKNNADEQPAKKNKPSVERVTTNEIEIVSTWLKDPDQFFFIKQNEEIIAMPVHLHNDLVLIQSSLYIKKAGVKMGAVIRNGLIPNHELALSTILKNDTAAIEVDLPTALQYLRRNEIKLDTPLKGWALIKHRQQPLGWVKILPNRINNYYPKEWRILNK